MLDQLEKDNIDGYLRLLPYQFALTMENTQEEG